MEAQRKTRNKEDLEPLRRAVRDARTALGISQDELAARCGLATGMAIGRIETNGVVLPDPATWQLLTDELGLSRLELLAACGYLLPEDAPSHPPPTFRYERRNGEVVATGDSNPLSFKFR